MPRRYSSPSCFSASLIRASWLMPATSPLFWASAYLSYETDADGVVVAAACARIDAAAAGPGIAVTAAHLTPVDVLRDVADGIHQAPGIGAARGRRHGQAALDLRAARHDHAVEAAGVAGAGAARARGLRPLRIGRHAVGEAGG